MRSLADSSVLSETLARVRALRFDAPALWGKMNVHQMICHLSDSFLNTTGQRPTSTRTDVFQRTIVKWFALYFPAKWPKGVQTLPEADQLKGGTPPVQWESDRAELLRLMEWFALPQTRKTPHPIFGQMTEPQWMRWAYLHCDHHLRQFGA